MHDKKVEPVLTDYDITINSIHRENMFKGTITICIVYAIFAFILIAAAYFSDNIRDLLFDRFLPFTLIYIIGTIIIILIFIYYIVSFVPKKIDKNKLDDSISCPDFWKLEILDDNVIENSFDTTNYNKKLFKYRCVMDDKVFNKGAIYKQDKNTDTNLQYKLGNKPAIVTPNSKDGANIYNDTYNSADAGSLSLFLKEENDKHYHLYKDINKYKNKNLIYTNNNITSTNIQKDLIDAALIMNNYEKKSTSDTSSYYYQDKLSITAPTAGDISTGTSLPSTGLKNYLNSPNNLTWASTLSTTGNDIAIVRDGNIDNKYLSVVYDWSTFDLIKYKDKHGKTKTYVYALDETIASGNANIANVGTIEYESKDGTYIFKTIAAGITISSTLFTSKINTEKNYYLDKTIISTDSALNTYQDPNNASTFFGPKVRLYNKTERPKLILKDKALTEQIPLTCSAVYPSFLASKEGSYSENNTLRCAYSEICKIPWSDLHCNKINIQ